MPNTQSEGRAMPNKTPPPGYHSITPAIVVRDGSKAIEFYKRAFGAEELNRMEGPGGSLMHAEIRIGDSIIMLGEENVDWGTRSPLSTNGTPSSLHIYVPNADATYDRALKEGAKVRYPLEDAFWGDRYGKVTDPFGHEWGIATHVKDLSLEETQKAAEAWMAQVANKVPEGAGA